MTSLSLPPIMGGAQRSGRRRPTPAAWRWRMAEGNRPSWQSFLANLRKPVPLRRKVWLVARNWLKVRKADTCCGHPGEPGC
jgi:hypothetical protein